ncbi:peptide-methionine (S)-S-oxide reductase MsrA [Thermodesulfobacteriota bacterium]
MIEILACLIGLMFILMVADVSGSETGADTGAPDKGPEKATFAGGCFWCMEPPFDKLDGMISTTVGYTGGKETSPTYEQVCSGQTGHAEAIEVIYDPKRISYSDLLEVFWRNINPTQVNGQFVDRGSQYRTAIFYHTEEQRRQAELSKEKIQKSGRFDRSIATEIVPAAEFYPAEDYHQDYYTKSPDRYKIYRYGSGRDHYLNEVWRKESSESS